MLNKKRNRDFGLLIFAILLIAGFYPYLIHDEKINLILVSISFIFGLLGVLKSKILTPLTLLWFKIGQKLGTFLSPVIIKILYLILIIPVGLILRVIKKNYLNIRQDKKIDTYWENKDNHKTSMDNEF